MGRSSSNPVVTNKEAMAAAAGVELEDSPELEVKGAAEDSAYEAFASKKAPSDSSSTWLIAGIFFLIIILAFGWGAFFFASFDESSSKDVEEIALEAPPRRSRSQSPSRRHSHRKRHRKSRRRRSKRRDGSEIDLE